MSVAGKSSTYFNPPKLKDFVVTEKLGSGTYANVYKAFKKTGEKREVLAIKCVKKSSLNKVSIENLLIEIEILKQIKHEHIVNLIDFQWDESYIYLIMEYCAGGDLSGFIQAKRSIPEYVVKRFLQQIGSALFLLHENNISHMDLKPQNILLSSTQNPILKLADFGFAQHLETFDDNSLRGSPLYMAPEMILKQQYDSKVDLWSIGVILFEALYGHAPFASKTLDELLKKFQSDRPILFPIYPRISTECRNLLEGLLQRDPKSRISFSEFFAHPFVDLEHRPSSECLNKASEIVIKAVEEDHKHNVAKAIQLYSDAIQYFVPAIYYEKDDSKKETLRKKVTEYCSRAEQLKRLSKCSQDMGNVPRQQIIELSKNDPILESAINKLYTAKDKENNEEYETAMELYEQALEVLIPLISKLSPSLFRDLVHEQVNTHLKYAESLRQFISINHSKNKLKDSNVAEKATGTQDSLCRVQ